MAGSSENDRHLGLLGATGVGVGAIVGGGILALAGVAFAATGPSAIIAFALNGVIALLTALSFAELAAAFPESGGTYTFAKKVLTVETAFAVGWVVWFASIVAAVLYALGFGYFASIAIQSFGQATGHEVPGWAVGRPMASLLAILATSAYTLALLRTTSGGGQWANLGKVIVFAILIAGGVFALRGRSPDSIREDLQPFFAHGASGLIQAMGFSFIALQGFDLIAAVGGEIRDPTRTIPRAMFLSLGAALAIYLPLLFVVTTVGMPTGATVADVAAENPEAIVAIAAENFLGPFGFWLVIIAAILSMLSALQANLFAASRVALSMARDRTLPKRLSRRSGPQGVPVAAVLATALVVVILVSLLGNVGAAGAASSLIFLITFSLAHLISIMARRRGKNRSMPFRVPWFPLIPLIGIAACVTLAVFQGIAVPSAGVIAASWLLSGGVLFIFLFARRARVVDAWTSAHDPNAARLRGRSPLVLVPMANPANAEPMVAVANALAPPDVGRVLMLSVVVAPTDWRREDDPKPLADAQAVLAEALSAAMAAGFSPEALTTIAPWPWPEISRVARTHRCESLLLGLSDLADATERIPLDKLMGTVSCDVVVLRSQRGWQLADVQRILVPLGGRGGHDELRARLLGSLFRTRPRHVTFLRVVAENTRDDELRRAKRELRAIADDEAPAHAEVSVVRSSSPAATIAKLANDSDLMILGLSQLDRRRRAIGDFTLQIARATTCSILMIGRRG